MLNIDVCLIDYIQRLFLLDVALPYNNQISSLLGNETVTGLLFSLWCINLVSGYGQWYAETCRCLGANFYETN